MATAEAAKVSYTGNCHCDAIKFELRTRPLDEQEVSVCNCSICSRNGYMHIYVMREELKYLKGGDAPKGYYFGKKKAEHRFCSTCGCSMFVDPHGSFGSDIVAVNVRMLQGVDLDGLKIKNVDGKSYQG
ncbi:MAG: hypothetical protein Q9174_000052 [Haloplaca sp. 1 TL-2023]